MAIMDTKIPREEIAVDKNLGFFRYCEYRCFFYGYLYYFRARVINFSAFFAICWFLSIGYYYITLNHLYFSYKNWAATNLNIYKKDPSI